ncbi:MAG: hypothetical protein AAB268_13595 [Elusimicrobiota bacterium]
MFQKPLISIISAAILPTIGAGLNSPVPDTSFLNVLGLMPGDLTSPTLPATPSIIAPPPVAAPLDVIRSQDVRVGLATKKAALAILFENARVIDHKNSAVLAQPADSERRDDPETSTRRVTVRIEGAVLELRLIGPPGALREIFLGDEKFVVHDQTPGYVEARAAAHAGAAPRFLTLSWLAEWPELLSALRADPRAMSNSIRNHEETVYHEGDDTVILLGADGDPRLPLGAILRINP